MPLREYGCKKCGHVFEVLERTDGEKVVCEVCASSLVERKLSVFATTAGGTTPEAMPSCAQRCANAGNCEWAN